MQRSAPPPRWFVFPSHLFFYNFVFKRKKKHAEIPRPHWFVFVLTCSQVRQIDEIDDDLLLQIIYCRSSTSSSPAVVGGCAGSCIEQIQTRKLVVDTSRINGSHPAA